MYMKQIALPVFMVALCVGSVESARSAEAPLGTKRPKILQIFMEDAKPGRQPAHEKNEAGWPAALRKANSKGYYLAMTSGSQSWFVTPRESFAAAEAVTRDEEANAPLSAEVDRLWALDGEMLSKANGITAVLNEDLGYRADWDTAKTRYYTVTVIRLQPGFGRDYEELRKVVNAAHAKANVDERWAVYEVVAGAPNDTYIFMSPVTSLAEWDKYEANHGKEYGEAMGEDARNRLRDFSRVAVKSSETQLFRFNPKMSYLPKEMTDRDPDFWTPKAVAAAAKKDEKKP